MGKRTYGTGSLRVVGQSWVGQWYGPDGRRVKRKIGPARKPGSTAGLTKAQAEYLGVDVAGPYKADHYRY